MRLPEDLLREVIGMTVRYEAPDPLGAAAFRYFAVAVGDHNPVYLDPAAARRLGHDSVIAPPTLVCETNQYTAKLPDANGYVGHGWSFAPAGAVWIRGGNDYRIGRPVRPTDRLHVVWCLVDAANKTTRSGREVVRLISEATYTDEVGDFLAWNREIMFLADPEDDSA
jgi:acyl dehydratase